jgi:hypothetical protein
MANRSIGVIFAVGVVRNMMTTRDGNIVLACSGVNRVTWCRWISAIPTLRREVRSVRL